METGMKKDEHISLYFVLVYNLYKIGIKTYQNWFINYGIFAQLISIVERKYQREIKLGFIIRCSCLLMMFLAFKAQAYSKIDSAKVALDSLPYFFNDQFSGYRLLDTSLTELHRYNPLFRKNNFYSITGHITLPSRNIFYHPQINDGLTFANTQHDLLYLNNDDVQFMHTYYPITTVKAVIGSKKEQLVELLHSQQIIPTLNVGFRINGIRTSGYYNKQQANTIGFQAFTSYMAKNGIYRSFFSYTYNRILTQLNGGLQPDSLNTFTYESLSDKALIPVYLNSAKHQIYGSDVYTKQIIGLDRKLKKGELSAFHDSSTALNKIAVYGRYQEFFRHYEDQFLDTSYYKNLYITTELYNNKVRAQKTKASVALYNTIAGHAVDHYIGYELEAGLENLDVTIVDFKQNYFSTFVKAALAKNLKPFSMKLEAKYFLNGYNAQNYQALFSVNAQPLSSFKWSILAGMNALNTDVVNNFYFSNNFKWNNTFKTVNHSFINANLAYKWAGNLFLQYSIINNYVFVDSAALPSQLSNSISLLQIKYYKIFKWKALYFIPEILYQLDASEEQFLGLPKFYAKTSLFFEKRIFKNNLWLRFGTDVFWLNSYRPYTYMAATNMFHYQTKFNTGNLPLADLFLSFKIKTVEAFVRLEQLSTIAGAPYFFSPYYAMPGFTFKLGLNWLFIN
jgi:hypothetical protein